MPTNAFTIEAWINWDGVDTGAAVIVASGDLASNGYALQLDTTTGALEIAAGGGATVSSIAGAVAADTWTHVAVSFGNNSAALYVDGSNVTSGGSSAPFSFTAPSGSTTVGAALKNATASDHFGGQVDSLQFWDFARNGVEIARDSDEQIDPTNEPGLPGGVSGLVAAYRFDERVGETLIDEAGSNDLSFKRGGTDPLQLNTLGRAIEFDGADQVVTVSDDSSLDLTDGATIEFWVNASSLSGTQVVLAKGDGGPLTVQFSDASVQWVTDHGGAADTQTSSGTLGSAAWHHVAVTFDDAAQTKAIYIDGALDSSKSVTAGALSTNGLALTLGAALNGGGTPINEFKGLLDQVAVFDHARTAAEIKLDMTEPLTGGESGLVAYYDFAEASGTTVQDGSGNGNSGTISGATRLLTAPDIGGGSVVALRTAEDTSASGFLTASDPVENHTITYGVTTQASNGTVTIDATSGQWTYTPDDNYTGSDTFTLRMQDNPPGPDANDTQQSAQFETKTFTVTVDPADDVKALAGAPSSGREDTNLGFESFSLSGSDEETVTVELRVGNGTLSLRDDITNGLVAGDITDNGSDRVTISATVAKVNATFASGIGTTYRGNEGFNGSDTIELRVVRGDGTAEFETIDLAIAAVDDDEKLSIGVAQLGGAGDSVTAQNVDLDGRSFTLEMWVNLQTADAFDYIVDHRVAPGTSPGADEFSSLQIGYESSGDTFFFQFDNGAAKASIGDNDDVGTWVHWAAVYDATADLLSLYKDGVRLAGASAPGKSYIGEGELTLGVEAVQNNGFQGLIDEFRVWDGARTAEEIAAHYNQQVDAGNADLIAYYRFDEPFADEVVRDVSPNALDGSYNGDAEQIHGPVGRALDFDGSDDAVEVADAAALEPTAALSVEAWVKVDSLTGLQAVVAKGKGTDVSYQLLLNDAKVQLDTDHVGGAHTLASAASLTIGQWHHIAVTYDDANDTKAIYIDGTLDTSATVTLGALNTNADPLAFGARIDSDATTDRHLDGQIAEVRLWNVARTAGEIDRFYDQPLDGANPPSTGLVGLWTFDETSGTTAADAAGNYDGTIAGAAHVDTAPDVPGTAATTREEVAVRGFVDGDDASASSFLIVDSPDNGSVTLDPTTGAWVYIPDDDFRGTDTFNTRATGSGHDIETVTVTVRPVDAGVAHGGVAQFGVRDGTADGLVTDSAVNLAGSFSFEFWGRRADTPQAGTARLEDGDIAIGQESGGLHIGFQDGDASGSTFVFGFDTSGNALTYADSDDNLDTWVHWAGTYDATTNARTLYRNGVEVAADTASADYGGNAKLIVGRADGGLAFSAADGWHGQLDEMRLWSGVRSAREIADNYNQVLFADPGDATKLDDLLLHFDFDDRNGTTADNVAGSNDATFESGAAAPAFLNGAGRALDFDGSSARVTSSTLYSGGTHTLEAWINTTETTDGAGLVSLGEDTFEYMEMSLAVTGSNGTLRVTVFDGTGSARIFEGTKTINDGLWHHVAFSYDASSDTLTAYVDGAVAAGSMVADNAQSFSLTTEELFVGTDNTRTKFTDGEIDEVRVWQDVRSGAEIAEFYNQPLVVGDPEASDLITYWTFDEIGGGVEDATSNDNDGTITAATRVGTAPTLYGQELTTVEDVGLAGAMTNRFADAGTPTFSLLSSPSSGRLEFDTASGVWRYQPLDDFFGDVSFRVRATDSDGFQDDELVKITVENVDDTPDASLMGRGVSFDSANTVDNTATGDKVTLAGFSGMPSTAFSTEMWVKTSDTGGGLLSYASTATQNDLLLVDPSSLTVYIAGVGKDTGVDVSDGEWHHLAVTWTNAGGALKVYKDGVLAFEGTHRSGHIITSNGTLVLGQDQDNIGGGFHQADALDGQLDEVRIWNDVRSEAEIQANMYEPLAGSEAGLELNWRFNELLGAAAEDQTSGNNDGTIAIGVDALDADRVDSDVDLRILDGTAVTLKQLGTELDQETLTVQSVTQGGKGAVTITGGGTTITYTPTVGASGADSFSYTLVDASGNTDTETVAVTLQSAPLTSNMLRGVEFDSASTQSGTSTGDRVELASFAAMPASAFTAEMWVKTNDTGSGLLSYAVSGSNNELMFLRPESLRVFIDGASVNTGVDVSDGEWHHLAVSWTSSGGALKVYKDGVLAFEGTHKSGASLAANGTLMLGNEQDSVGGKFEKGQALDGTIDEFRLWNDVRSESEIRGNMYEPLSDGTGGLVVNWRFNDFSGDTAADQAVAGDGAGAQDGTLVTTDRVESAVDVRLFDATPITLQQVLADADGNSTITATTNGSKGTVSTDGTNITYTPTAFASGADSFTYTVSDGTGIDKVVSVDVDLRNTPQAANMARGLDFDSSNTVDGTATGDQVTLANFNDMPATALTVELWVRSDTINGGLLSYATTGLNNAVLLEKPQDLQVYINNAQIDTGVDVNDGDWHHLAVTWQSSDGALKVYKDGALAYTGTVKQGASILAGGTLVLGQDQDSVGGGFQQSQAFDGQLDEVRLWDDVRTQAEIQANMYDALVDGEPGLVVNWRLNEATGTTAGDNATLGDGVAAHDGTIAGATRVETNVTVRTNDTDPVTLEQLGIDGDGDTTSVTATTNGTKGTVTTNGTTVTYTPSAGTSGSDTFTYTLDDGTGLSDTMTVTVDINRTPVVTNYNPGSAAVFNGTTAQAASAAALSLTSHTVEAWLQTTDKVSIEEGDDPKGLLVIGDSGGPFSELTLFDGGRLRVSVEDGAGSSRTFITDVTDPGFTKINDGAWHHVAYSFDSASDAIALYIDGTLESLVTVSSDNVAFATTNEAVRIGTDAAGTANARVAVDEVRVWSDVRTAQEIADNYQGQVAAGSSNLAAYYRMDDRTGTSVTDSAGSNDLTLSGGAFFAGPDRGVSLDGVDDHVSLSASAINNLSSGTIEAWIYLDSNNEETITAKQDDGAANTYALFTVGHNANGAGDAGRLYFQGQNGTIAESTTLVSTGQWTHVAVTFQDTPGPSSTALFYVNGKAAGGSINFGGDYSVPNDFSVTATTIGAWLGDGGGKYFDGLIDELRIWSVARSEADILADMNDQLGGSETGLEAYWRFNETTGTLANDLAGTATNGTLTNGAAFAEIGADVSGTRILTSADVGATLFHAATDADGDATTVLGPDDPASGTAVQNADGSFTYQPPASAGSDSLGYQVTDDQGGQADVSASVEIV